VNLAAQARRWRTWWTQWLSVSVGVLLAAMLLIALTQVLLRYVFSQALVWAEEVSIVMLLALTWVGVALLWAQRRHIAIDVFVARYSTGQRLWLARGCDLLALAGGLLLMHLAQRTAVINAGMEMASLPVDTAWIYRVVMLGGALLAASAALNLLAQDAAGDDGATGVPGETDPASLTVSATAQPHIGRGD